MRSIEWALIVVGMVCLLSCKTFAEDANALPRLIPTPKEMAWAKGDKPAWLSQGVIKTIVLPARFADVKAGVDLLNVRLSELKLPALTIADQGSPGDKGTVWLGIKSAEAGKLLGRLKQPGEQGYRLAVGDDWVVILGQDLPGLFYGLTRLRQLVQPDGRIPQVMISDSPDLPLRGTYVAGDPGNRIAEFAALKLNLVLIESSDFYHLDDPAIRAKWQERSAQCRAHFIDLVPELQCLGWGHLVLQIEPRAVEAVYADKVRLIAQEKEIAAPVEPPAPTIDIANAGFEEGKEHAAAAWGQDDAGQCIFLDATEKHNGNQSLRITVTQKGTKRAWHDVTCLPEKTYELSGWMKLQDVKEGAAYIEVYGLTESGTLGDLIAGTERGTGTQAWQRMACAFSSGNYARLQIYVRIQDGTGTAWFDDVALTGTPPPNPLDHVVITDAAPFVLTDAKGEVQYEVNTDYRLLNPAVLEKVREMFDGKAGPVLIERIATGRIKPGDTVLASFHYAPPGSITCCPSEPLYQDLMRRTIRNVIAHLKPKYLHIGHDEPRVINRDLRCTSRKLSSAELFADDVKRMQGFVREADPNVRMMMWADAVNPYHNAPHLGMEKVAELLPRDIVLCAWFYHWPDPLNLIEKSVVYFKDLGFDVTGSPWFGQENTHHWAEVLQRQRETSPHVLGEIYTSWSDTTQDPWQALRTAAAFSWNASAMSLEAFLKSEGR